MKNIHYIFCSILSFVLIGCDPVEDRMNLGSAITADQLAITATPVMVDGKKSNKVILDNKSTYVVAWMVQHKQTFP